MAIWAVSVPLATWLNFHWHHFDKHLPVNAADRILSYWRKTVKFDFKSNVVLAVIADGGLYIQF